MAGHGRTTLLLAALLGVLVAAPAAQAAPPVFEPATAAITTGAGPVAAIADMNGDGRQDVVVAGDNKVSVQLMRADGSFSTIGPYFLMGMSARRVQLVDADGDGRRDILVQGSYEYATFSATAGGEYVQPTFTRSGRRRRPCRPQRRRTARHHRS